MDKPLDPMPLQDALAFLSEKFDVPIRIDHAAFTRMRHEHPYKLYEKQVKLPVVKGMTVGEALRELLSQIGPDVQGAEGGAYGIPITYRPRNGQILIVPAYYHPYSAGAGPILNPDIIAVQQNGEPITIVIKSMPLEQAIQELAAQTGANIVLDVRWKKEAQGLVSATFNDVALLAALRVLCDMAGLKPVVIHNVYYVTTILNTNRIERELELERDPEAREAARKAVESTAKPGAAGEKPDPK
jgi:hypothetical protein